MPGQQGNRRKFPARSKALSRAATGTLCRDGERVALVVPFGSMDKVAEPETYWLDLHGDNPGSWFWLLPVPVRRFTHGATARQDRLDLLRMGDASGWTLRLDGVTAAVLPNNVRFPPKASGRAPAIGCARL